MLQTHIAKFTKLGAENGAAGCSARCGCLAAMCTAEPTGMAGGVAEQQETEQPRQVKEFLAAEENEPPYPVTMLQTMA